MVRVTSMPRAWPEWNVDRRYRRMVLRRFPYLLFYEIRDDVVEFVAVAHTRRRPGYWLSRLGTSKWGGTTPGRSLNLLSLSIKSSLGR